MANPEHEATLKQGVKIWNEWRVTNTQVGVNLTRANLGAANLAGANLGRADLSGANLARAVLWGAHVPNANLHGAILTEAYLSYAELGQANLGEAELREAVLLNTNLSEANLVRADLRGADLSRANLSRAILTEAMLSRAILTDANLSRADLTNADLRAAVLIGTNCQEATLTSCRVYGISAWNVTLQGAQQSDLIITLDDETIITVDNLEVAQFIYLLLRHENLRDVLNAVTKQGVLLLGRFSNGGIEILKAIAKELRALKYLPIIFDFDRPDNKNYTETVKTLVGLSRFVIVDLSGPSVPQELYATVPHFKIPFVPIVERGRKAYPTFKDILEYDWVLKPVVEFENIPELVKSLPSKIIAPAEDRHNTRQALLDQLFAD